MPNPITQPQAWWNAGRNPALKNAPWGDIRQIFGKNINPNTLLGDDFLQRGYGKGGPGSGWDWSRGFRPGVSAETGGFGSGPTEAGRRALGGAYNFLKNYAGPTAIGAQLWGQGQEGSALDQATEAMPDLQVGQFGISNNPETDIGKRTGDFLKGLIKF